MKTLVVFSALVAVALAAPAEFQENEDFKKTSINVPEIFKRERKSAPQESTSVSNQTPGAQINLPSSSQNSESASSRSFTVKKPIIIKKKLGYHVYRDSDEEQVESGESCSKQVKVKLCDDKPDDKMRSSTIEDTQNMDTQMTEEDMRHSIKLAKEAVEHLQRDLKIVERKPGTKASAWKHGHSESDAELHQDIEVAREALEHIHKNFGNLESMSLHATTLEKKDTIQDPHLPILKTEEQRLAQWKEAMDTIQKNFEIAKNIEDSFKAKATSGETGLLFSNDGTDHENKHELNKITDFMRTNEDVPKKEEKAHSETCKTETLHEKSSKKDDVKTGLVEDDMISSASTMSEQNIEQNSEKAKQAGISSNIHQDTLLQSDKSLDNAHKKKDAGDMETVDFQNLFLKNSVAADSMKTIEETKERKSESVPQNKNHSLTEAITDNVPEATNMMKSVESEDMLLEHERNAATNINEQPHKSMKPEDHMHKMETTEKQNLEMNSAEHVNQKHDDMKKNEGKTQDKPVQTEHAREDETMTFMKSAEQNPVDKQKQLLEHTKATEHAVNTDQLEHHLNEAKMAQEGALKRQTENIAPKNAEQVKTPDHMQSMMHPEMRAAEDFNTMHQHHHHQLAETPQTRWAEDEKHHLHMESMKSADGIPSQSMDHAQKQHPGHHRHLAHGMKSHHFDTPTGHEQLHSRFPDNFMPQGKSADMDMQSYYMNMRDSSGLGQEGHRFRWRPMHEAARSAYGAPAAAPSSSGGGAVGVFPNAKVGGCGIPLLLSCNPSVVSGNLASSPPAPYSAPAYRSEDDFNFHNKRDVKKSHENLPSPIHRTPSNVNLKTSNVLVAKQ